MQSTRPIPTEIDESSKFAPFLTAGEKQIQVGYHWIRTETSDQQYMERFFFPETMQMTSEEYFADDKFKIRNGPNRLWYDNGVLHREGNYNDDQRIGIWTDYHKKSGNTNSKGSYIKGHQNGQWEYFYPNGSLRERLKFQNGVRDGEFESFDTLGVTINSGIYKADTIYEQTNPNLSNSLTEVMPYLTECGHHLDELERNDCSKERLLQYIYKNVRYPERAIINEIEGMAIAQFVVEKDGTISEIDVFQGISRDIKREVQRIIENMPSWEAGEQSGEKVRVLYTIPVRFKLQ